MNIRILGSCSGTEPMPDWLRAWGTAIRGSGRIWIAAPEGCSRTAHLAGLDLLSTRAIFISHTHMDHIGGLPNLLWTLRKLDSRQGRLAGKTVRLYLPDRRAWPAISALLSLSEGGFQCKFNLDIRDISDGVIYDEGGLRVTALHTSHMGHDAQYGWRAFGFSVEADGKKLVYTGDTGGYDDYAPLLENCDLLLHETGHHDPLAAARRLAESGRAPKRLGFIHHGRTILADPEGVQARLNDLDGINAQILNDGDAAQL